MYYAQSPWHSTVLGSATHHVFEAIAESKVLARDGKKWKNDDLFGRIYADKFPIDKWKDIVYNHYTTGKEGAHLQWEEKHWVDFNERVDKGLDDDWSVINIDPADIVQPELLIDNLPIEKDWAKPFVDEYGKEHKHLNIKGFIDLVFRIDGMLYILDYKTGLNPPKDWTTGRRKTYSEYLYDVQLNFYYHAATRYFKEPVTARIWFLSLKKPLKWELPIDDEYFDVVMEGVQKDYETLKTLKTPNRACDQGKDGKWSCIRMKCPYAMQTMGDFGRKDLEVNHDPLRDTFSSVNGKACVCDTIKYFNEFRTLEEIQNNCKKKRK